MDTAEQMRKNLARQTHEAEEAQTENLELRARIAELEAEQPSTAEAQARALEDFAKKMRRHAKEADLSPAERRVRRRAAQFADAEAKRIREESK